jgi:hypothetical protein
MQQTGKNVHVFAVVRITVENLPANVSDKRRIEMARELVEQEIADGHRSVHAPQDGAEAVIASMNYADEVSHYLVEDEATDSSRQVQRTSWYTKDMEHIGTLTKLYAKQLGVHQQQAARETAEAV